MKKQGSRQGDANSLAEQLQAAIAAAQAQGWTIRQISAAAGVPLASLADFATGRGGFSLTNAGKLAAWCGMRLTGPTVPWPGGAR